MRGLFVLSAASSSFFPIILRHIYIPSRISTAFKYFKYIICIVNIN